MSSNKRYKKILVTGGAGFIGSHLVDLLIKKGYKVKILDNLDPQVHPRRKKPSYLNPQAEFIKGDVNRRADLERALSGVEAVFHEAAKVGVGQSMYEIASYTKTNDLGTALLLDLMVNKFRHQIKKMIVASSMSTYGEGEYRCPSHGIIKPPLRRDKQMKKKDWEVHCPRCGKYLKPLPTPEETPQMCNSIYAVNKRNQEEMVLAIGRAYKIPAVALRYFNTYGPRQSLSNPYTGAAAIFLSRIKNGHPPVVYEDGLQTRDFVSVYDVARANLAVLENDQANWEVFNVGTGKAQTIRGVAEIIARLCKVNIKPEIQNKFRVGDIRHCIADIKKIKKMISWKPQITFPKGMKELIEWGSQEEAKDLFEKANQEFKKRKLLE